MGQGRRGWGGRCSKMDNHNNMSCSGRGGPHARTNRPGNSPSPAARTCPTPDGISFRDSLAYLAEPF